MGAIQDLQKAEAKQKAAEDSVQIRQFETRKLRRRALYHRSGWTKKQGDKKIVSPKK